MEKYGVVQSEVEELVKLGVAKTEEDARELVAAGKAARLIKEAQIEREKQDR